MLPRQKNPLDAFHFHFFSFSETSEVGMRWYRDVIKQIGSAIRFQDDTSARARRVDKHPKRTNFHFPHIADANCSSA